MVMDAFNKAGNETYGDRATAAAGLRLAIESPLYTAAGNGMATPQGMAVTRVSIDNAAPAPAANISPKI